MYSKAKPLALARSTMQPRLSSIGLLGLAGEHHVGAGEADAEARVGRALDEEAAALGAVGEGLADRAVDALALGALALQDRDGAAQHRLADAVLGAALDADGDALGVEGAEALAGDRAAVELELGELVVLGRPPGRRRRSAARAIAPASSVPSTRSLASVARGNSTADACGRRRRRRRAPAISAEACFGLHPDRPGDDQAGLGARLDEPPRRPAGRAARGRGTPRAA